MSDIIETPVEQEQQPQTPPESERVPGEEALGDPGRRALDAMEAGTQRGPTAGT